MKRDLLHTYLEKIQSLISEKYKDSVVSLILFGSLTSNKSMKSFSTDVDLIIVVKDLCSKTIKNEIIRKIRAIEKQLLVSYGADGLISGIQRATGMFTNQFVCYYSDFLYRRFHRVFCVNRFISSILAPQNSVWFSLKNNYQILFGEDLIKQWISIPNLTQYDYSRSLFMNWFLSIGAAILCIFDSNALKFSMEAIKWSLFTWRNFLNLKTNTIEEIMKNYFSENILTSIELNGLKEFLLYRSKKRKRRSLAIYGVILIPFIHLRIHKFR